MYKNILIVKLSAIGDVIHALPVAHALKKCNPQAKITWVVEKPAYDLLTNNPNIDEIIVFDKPQYKTLSGLLKHAPAFIQLLRRGQYDLALDLQGLFKSGLISYLSGAKLRLVYENAREGSDLLSKKIIGAFSQGHVIDRCLDVVRALGCNIDNPVFDIYITPEEQALTGKIMAQAGVDIQSPYAVLALGANWPNKIWPYEHFAQLSDQLYADGIVPVMVGGKGDRLLAESVQSLAKIPPVDLTGKTTLKQLAYVIQKAKLFVGGDTGPMHLAAAMGTPVVALMGPTDVSRNGPYGQGHAALVASRDCAGCWQRRCPKQLDCLAVISPQTVYETIKTLIGRNVCEKN